MSERGDHSDERVDEAIGSALLAALHDENVDVRIEALSALVTLPLSEEAWRVVVVHAKAVLRDHATVPASELRAVVAAAPWIPFASVRNAVGRIARGEVDADADAQAAATAVAPRLVAPQAAVADWQPRVPVGFTLVSESERQALSALTVPELWNELGSASGPRAAVLVTLLMRRARDAESGYRVATWVEGQGTAFRPDLEGLFTEFRRIRAAAFDVERMFVGWQIGWLVSRGGLVQLLIGLDAQLTSADRDERLAALGLIQFAGAYAGRAHPPADGVGVGVDPIDPRHSIPYPASIIDDADRPAPGPLQFDDDVQFTVYRPSRVQPERWYPLLAFAHRTDPFEDSTGAVLDPVEEVARQAEALLSGEPGSFDLLRADSGTGLRRGTDLLFEPWLESGRINPPSSTLRWEEPVHRVEFRISVPASADGLRINGGVRVFAGPMLIGDVSFRLPVDATPAPEATTRDTARRFRQIFASYSHRDAEVVEAVERYTTLTGDRYLIDVHSLRSGERWDERLRQLIDKADIFQLFWSRNAMYSRFVQQEYEYALLLSREGFVRPVYWEDPLPEDPDRNLPSPQLRSLHFSRLNVERTTDSAAQLDTIDGVEAEPLPKATGASHVLPSRRGPLVPLAMLAVFVAVILIVLLAIV